jgi:hypothetical protein
VTAWRRSSDEDKREVVMRGRPIDRMMPLGDIEPIDESPRARNGLHPALARSHGVGRPAGDAFIASDPVGGEERAAGGAT